MSNIDGITDDVRNREEDYFRRKDRELIERMRQSAEAARLREELGNRTGIHDEASLRELEQLGFTIDTCALLPLIPLLQVAWADTTVTVGERDAIVAYARTRGIDPGTPADVQLASWLEQRPSEETFRKSTRLISAMIDHQGPAAEPITAADLIARCEAIATASGGLFGVGAVSTAERAALHDIAARLRQS